MFVQKIYATTLFSSLLLAMLLAAPATSHGQIVTQVDCGCQQPACDACNQCDCGQPSCIGCRGRLLQRRARPCDRCPNCNAEVCISETKIEKEARSCWKTEQKVICVPKVRFPWQKCDGPMCGQTRTITLLKKHNYECEVCKHEWKILKPELPTTPEDAGKTSAMPPIVPGIQAIQPYNTLPPAAPVVNSLPYESNILPASTPRIIQGNGGR